MTIPRLRRLAALASAALAATALAAVPLTLSAAPASAADGIMLNQPKSLGGWGVVGYEGSTSPVTTFKSNVTAIAEYNGTMYIGGMFTGVARNGAVQADQRYLAAFDRATGAWVSSFRPQLTGGVWDIVVTPEGKLAVGGYFNWVNGEARSGVVLLDPATGAVDPGFQLTLTAAVGRVGVRTMDLANGMLYLGGNFNAATGGTGADVATIKGKNLFRVKATTGRPDGAFKPWLSTAPWQVDVSTRGDRVYAAGKFGTVNGVTKGILAVLSTANGTLVPGVADVVPTYCAGCNFNGYAPYSEAVLETADTNRVVVMPTEHAVQLMGRDTLNRLYGHVTLPGGDFQAAAETHGVIYASCHCWNTDYSGAYDYQLQGGYDGTHPIMGIGAYDAVTLRKIDTFSPKAYGQYGDGAWQLTVDSTGCLWAGGDFTHAGGGMWLGGFAKFCTS